MLNQKQIKKILDVGGILLYVIPAAYLFLSATLFQFTILTDLTRAVQGQMPNPAYHQDYPVFAADSPFNPAEQKEKSPLIPASKSIYLYFLVMTSLILSVIILTLFGQNLHYRLILFYQFVLPPIRLLCVPQFRAPPALP